MYLHRSFETFQCHHGLALLFIVFAIAVLFDPERPAYCIAAQEYYYLSRTSLGFAPPVRETTLTSIQVLVCATAYGIRPIDLLLKLILDSYGPVSRTQRLGISWFKSCMDIYWTCCPIRTQRKSFQSFTVDRCALILETTDRPA